MPVKQPRRIQTPDERQLQYAVSRARPPREDPTGERLLARLVPAEEGGIPHSVIVVFESRDDLEFQALQKFLATVTLE